METQLEPLVKILVGLLVGAEIRTMLTPLFTVEAHSETPSRRWRDYPKNWVRCNTESCQS